MLSVQIRRVAPLRGWAWVKRSIELFARKPLTWIVLNLVLLFIGTVLAQIPYAGGLLFALLTPVFAGGLLLGCRDTEHGKPLLPGYLFAGFRTNAGALVSIGGIYVVGQILISGLLINVGGAELQALLQAATGEKNNPALASVSDRAVAAAFLAGALFVPLAMAVWFAPALAALSNLRALESIRLSLQGCVRNFPAMAIYTLAMTALLVGLLFVVRSVLAMLPQNAGIVREPIAMLVMTFWVSLTLISAYIGYKEIFDWSEAPAAPERPA